MIEHQSDHSNTAEYKKEKKARFPVDLLQRRSGRHAGQASALFSIAPKAVDIKIASLRSPVVFSGAKSNKVITMENRHVTVTVCRYKLQLSKGCLCTVIDQMILHRGF